MGQRETELIRRWREGESSAFEELVRLWQQPIARFLSRYVGRSDLVQDLCQEVFLRVFQAQSSYRENGHFAGWIYRIALNAARDAQRRPRWNSTPLSNEPTAEDRPSCEEKELADALARAIAELPDALRTVLVLRHYQGLNFEEIARITETPASTLKSRCTAALTELRKRLIELGFHEEDQP
jgi:RNA polymerase sigma-70 factor (ECF subfamily)